MAFLRAKGKESMPENESSQYSVAFNVANDSAVGRDRDLSSIAATSAFRVGAKIPRESAFPYLTYLFGSLGLLNNFHDLRQERITADPRRPHP